MNISNEPEDKFYNVDRELLIHLQQTFPDRLPKRSLHKSELARLQGQRDVIDHLVYLLNKKR